MASGIPYDSDAGPRLRRRDHRAVDRRELRDLGRDGGRARPVPRLRRKTARRCCASSAITAAPRTGMPTGYEALAIAAGAARRRVLSRTGRSPRPRGAAWDAALALGETHGFRNAQVSVIAPTGTIGLVMDCDTTGIEPDFALVKFKKLAGGGYFKIMNRLVPRALRALGYGADEIADDRTLRARPRHAEGAPGDQPRDPGAPRASTKPRSPRIEAGARRGLRHQIRVQQMDPGRRVPDREARHRRRPRSPIPASTCWPRSASRAPRSTPPTPGAAAR